jgi:hypothetical protein
MFIGEENLMKTPFRTVTAALAIASVVTVCVSAASAECGNYARGQKATSLLPQSWEGPAEFGSASLLLVSNHDSDDDPIVGFWRSKFVVGGNVVDAGFSQWHSDGTEILNSSRPPATSSFCLGVWKRVERSTYKLNHFAISWDASGNFVGNTNIREDVTLSKDGNSYSGALTIDQYDPSGNPVAHIEGEVTATRITVHTTIEDVL